MTPTDVIGDDIRLFRADCRDVLPSLPAGSVDAVVTDPPYPEIDRPYGRLTECEWFALMDVVVPECRRVLKPTGSAVFILQPNSERAGRMRPWLWEFMAKWYREWNCPQDAWWWNHGALPTEMANHQGGMRASLKACVWLGAPNCWRDQSAVLLTVSEKTRLHRGIDRHDLQRRAGTPKAFRSSTLHATPVGRGGSTPHNVLVCIGGGTANPNVGHGAATPLALCDWWVRYICPPGGTVLDPFLGSGTCGLAARSRDFVGVERDPGYYALARDRLFRAAGAGAGQLFAGLEGTS